MEDLKRHKADHEVNNREAFVFGKDAENRSYQVGDELRYHFQSVPWKDVKVGDIVKVNDNQRLPADLVLLSSSRFVFFIISFFYLSVNRADGQCYLETSNLDGETNLKIRYVPLKCSFIRTEKELSDLQLRLECEGPNNRVYEFEGVLHLYPMRRKLSSKFL